MEGPVSEQPKKSNAWIWIVVVVAVVLGMGCCVVFITFGAYLNMSEGTTTSDNGVDATATEFELFDTGSDGSSREKAVPAGTVALANDMAFKVTGVTDPADELIAEEYEFNATAEPGKRYVMVTLDILCQADEKCDFALYDLTLVGSDGIARDPEYISELPDQLDSTEFFKDARLKGNIVYMMGEDETNLVLMISQFLGPEVYMAVE